MWRQLIWLGLGLLGVAMGKIVLIAPPPEGYPVRLYKLSLDQDGVMFVVTDAGIYSKTINSDKWSLFFKEDRENRFLRIIHNKSDKFLLKHKTLTKKPLKADKISLRVELPSIPIAFGENEIYYCGHISKNQKPEAIELPFPSIFDGGSCIGGTFHKENAYIFTRNHLLQIINENVKIIDRFHFNYNSTLNIYPDLIKFDLNNNLYTTAERDLGAHERGKEKLPRRFVVKIRPDGTLSKILNFGFKDFTPKSIELVGVVDNDVFINVNGKDLYVSRDGGKTASRISKIKNERNNINCAGFYEIIKGPDNLLYALDRDALYKSRDRGETWEIMDRKGIPSHYKD